MKMKMKKGFTLIELLVVVLIIGILSAVALPQYTKAVTKARFAEAMTNLKSLAQAHKVCYLEKGEGCSMDELSVSVGERDTEYWSRTKDFTYTAYDVDSASGVWAAAHYRREDVCLCYRGDGEIVVMQEPDTCPLPEPTMDYAKLLNLEEVSYSECGCC